MAKQFTKMQTCVLISLTVGFTCFAQARNFSGQYPICDTIISKWVRDHIGTGIDHVDYKFASDPGPGNYSVATAYPLGCDGQVRIELPYNQADCQGHAFKRDDSIRKVDVYGECN